MLAVKLYLPYMVRGGRRDRVAQFAVDKAEAFAFHIDSTFLENADPDNLDDNIEIDAAKVVDELLRLQGRPVVSVTDAESERLNSKGITDGAFLDMKLRLILYGTTAWC